MVSVHHGQIHRLRLYSHTVLVQTAESDPSWVYAEASRRCAIFMFFLALLSWFEYRLRTRRMFKYDPIEPQHASK